MADDVRGDNLVNPRERGYNRKNKNTNQGQDFTCFNCGKFIILCFAVLPKKKSIPIRWANS